jgi:hypothetical protein
MIQNEGDVSAGTDKKLITALIKIFKLDKGKRPDIIIETGTYHGEGTTAMVIQAIKSVFKRPDLALRFITIEADSVNFDIATQNLSKHKWVQVIHGSSVNLEKAEKFIKNDEMLLNHENYPDVKIDASDPIPFYLSEVRGKLFIFGGTESGEDDLFSKLESQLYGKIPLFVLDSCGGIGWLEFQEMLKLMYDRPLYVWLHDINHVKHYRSYLYIKDHPREWKIIDERPDNWVLAWRKK